MWDCKQKRCRYHIICAHTYTLESLVQKQKQELETSQKEVDIAQFFLIIWTKYTRRNGGPGAYTWGVPGAVHGTREGFDITNVIPR